ncbi:hypothetical protein EDC04DRAFT_2895059 [Pisolithus marmoratus]|nr:hypothetical protein EDC04DRAFT_2895059 [Pisolithus marmoratus]
MAQRQFGLQQDGPFPSVRSRPRVIDDLPLEIFCWILELALCKLGIDGHTRKRELASVSCRWRDVILDTPALWTSIFIDRRFSLSMLATHLKRSREALLDVSIAIEYPTFSALLRTAISSVHRWRRLIMISWEVEDRSIQFFFDRFNSLYFPSLRRVSVFSGPRAPQMRYPNFLLPQRSPALEHLEITEPLDGFPASSNLMRLSIWYNKTIEPSSLSFLTSQKLTYLEIRPHVPLPSPVPDSIYLPFLTFLGVPCCDIRKMFGAIVAPQLTHFTFWGNRDCDPPTKIFDGLEHKLINIRHLLMLDFSSTDIAKELCSRLPNAVAVIRSEDSTHVAARKPVQQP